MDARNDLASRHRRPGQDPAAGFSDPGPGRGPPPLPPLAAADFATKVASATAVGLTGFFGYVLGATVCNVATGMLVDRFGWNSAVIFYAASALAGCALLATTWKMASPLLRAPPIRAAERRSD